MILPVFYESPEAPLARIHECRMASSRQNVSAASLAPKQERRRRMRAWQWPLADRATKKRVVVRVQHALGVPVLNGNL